MTDAQLGATRVCRTGSTARELDAEQCMELNCIRIGAGMHTGYMQPLKGTFANNTPRTIGIAYLAIRSDGTPEETLLRCDVESCGLLKACHTAFKEGKGRCDLLGVFKRIVCARGAAPVTSVATCGAKWSAG